MRSEHDVVSGASKLGSSPVNVMSRLKETAPLRAARRAKIALERLVFERGLNDTGEHADLDELGVDAPGRRRYEASSWSFLRRALRRCKVASTDVFVDFGSGKGRVVWQAAHYPFARVIGVEISEDLNAAARSNIEGRKDELACADVELITADAAEFVVPDDMTFAYLYHPFEGDLFNQVIGRIVESLDRNPRPLTLIYANPQMDEQLRATGRFELQHVLKGLRPDTDETNWVNLYTSREPAEPSAESRQSAA